MVGMQPLLDIVRKQVSDVSKTLLKEIPNIRIAVITHGDYCDDGRWYWCRMGMIQVLDFTNNEPVLTNHIQKVAVTGGEGAHAAYEYVLRKAKKLSWRASSAKALVLIGDVVPNAPSRTV